jgi:hypothetical protein
MIQFGVQREGAARVRDRLTLRLLRTQHTAATADYLMVFTATACRSDPRTAYAFWISRHISKAHRFDVIVHFAQNSVNLTVAISRFIRSSHSSSSFQPWNHVGELSALFGRELFHWSVVLGHAGGQ